MSWIGIVNFCGRCTVGVVLWLVVVSSSVCAVLTSCPVRIRQYDGLYLAAAEGEDVDPTEASMVLKTNVVRRRFREFLNLHSRLEANPEYKHLLRGTRMSYMHLPDMIKLCGNRILEGSCGKHNKSRLISLLINDNVALCLPVAP